MPFCDIKNFGSDSKYASLAIVLAIILMILALLLIFAR